MAKKPPKFQIKTKSKPIKVLLVDGNALFKKAFFGAKNDYAYDGSHIGGLHIFLRLLRNYMELYTFKKVYVFWDGEESGRERYEIYPEYKSNRGGKYDINQDIVVAEELQKFKVQQYLTELGIRQLQFKYIEGDDLIAGYIQQKPDNEFVTIMTNDRDILQLINDTTRVYLIDIKKHIDKDNFKDVFGYHLENHLLVKMLNGDTSDMIKGVKGVSKKSLLTNFPDLINKKVTLNNIFEECDRINKERIDNKKKPFKAINNIRKGITNGSQGKRLYEINRKIMDLKNPLIDTNIKQIITKYIHSPLEYDSESITNVTKMMKNDGLYRVIGHYNFADFLLPYKQLLNREKKYLDEY